MREEKGVVDLINAMEAHESDSSVLEFTCSSLWGLTLEGTAIFRFGLFLLS